MWQRILSAEGLWTCPFVTETSMYLSAALQLAKQRHAPSTTFHNQKGKSYQKLTLHQFAYHILQLFWKTVLLKSWKQKTRLLPASTSWFFQQLWDIDLIIWDLVSSYFILFPRCFTMFHHLFCGTLLFWCRLCRVWNGAFQAPSLLRVSVKTCQNSPSHLRAMRHWLHH